MNDQPIRQRLAVDSSSASCVSASASRTVHTTVSLATTRSRIIPSSGLAHSDLLLPVAPITHKCEIGCFYRNNWFQRSYVFAASLTGDDTVKERRLRLHTFFTRQLISSVVWPAGTEQI